jgi:hypothetical protein
MLPFSEGLNTRPTLYENSVSFTVSEAGTSVPTGSVGFVIAVDSAALSKSVSKVSTRKPAVACQRSAKLTVSNT